MSERRVLHTARLAALIMLLNAANLGLAQSPGNIAISSNSSGTIAASSAYIDAFPFFSNAAQGNFDFCRTINGILVGAWVSYPASGAVVDARGVLPAPPQVALSCNGTTANPFNGVTVPSTILLPATNIQLSTSWTLPSNTRLIGVGAGIQNYTVLEASQTTSFTGNSLIEMGTNSGSTGVTVEHLKLDGLGEPTTSSVFDGIDNVSAGDGSYVNDVNIKNTGPNTTFTSISGTACTPAGLNGTVTGLCIGPGAAYSGPYTNIGMSPSANCNGNNDMCKQTACVKIQAQTRGLHGLTCTSNSSKSDMPDWPNAGVYLDSYNNSIENVHIEGFYDAIVVGDYADHQGGVQNGGQNIPSVSGNLIANVTGATGAGPVQNVVHICNPNLGTFTGACSQQSLTVNNLLLLQILSSGGFGAFNTAAIQDDNATWQGSLNPSSGIAYVGFYVLGYQPIPTPPGSLYSRITTNAGSSTPTPTWGAGSQVPLNCTNQGAIFSNTQGTPGQKNTIFVCSNGHWTGIGN